MDTNDKINFTESRTERYGIVHNTTLLRQGTAVATNSLGNFSVGYTRI